jgi:hypothetical protein
MGPEVGTAAKPRGMASAALAQLAERNATAGTYRRRCTCSVGEASLGFSMLMLALPV